MPSNEEIHYHMVKSKKLTFPQPRKEADQYDRPIGPTRPTAGERIKGAISSVARNRYVSGAIGAVKSRADSIAHEMQESPAKERREHRQRKGTRRAREPYDPPMGGVPMMPHNPFGVGAFSDGPLTRAASRPAAPAKKKRRRRAAQPRQESPYPMDPFGVGRFRL